jgi:hypothetical protein
MADFIRGADFHLDFINPSLKAITRKQQGQGDELDQLEKYMEDKYISHCEPGNPMHFMATWWIRGAIAKSRFIRNLAEAADSKAPRDEAHRDAGISYALRMLECDAKIVKSKMTQGFRWMIYLNFPFPAFVHIVHDLRRRPIGDHAVHAWEVMSENCAARFLEQSDMDSHMARRALPFHKIFYGVVMAAWAARETALMNAGVGGSEQPPQIIVQLRAKMEQLAMGNGADGLGEGAGDVSVGDIDLNMNAPMDAGTGFLMGGGNGDLMGQGMDPFSLMHMQAPMNMEVNHFGWPSMSGWNSVGGTGW